VTTSSLIGTGQLVRLALRRDRILAPLWVIVFTLVTASSASATTSVYPTAQSRINAANSINETPSLVAVYGKIYDATSLGAVSLYKLVAFGSALVGVFAIVMLVRHTRQEEEAGRLELVGAGVAGRRAALTAALLVVTATNLVLGATSALALASNGLPLTGSLVFGLAWAGNGIAFAAVAAVAVQLTTSARTASGIGMATLGASYVLRAIGDTSSSHGPWWLSWLSPIGWAQQLRPFAGNRWSVLGITSVFTIMLLVTAYQLASRRDLGAGLLADRPGRGTASRSLRTSLALALRLQRGLLVAWLTAFAVLGIVVGNISTNLGHLLDSQAAKDLITRLGGQRGLSDAFVAVELAFGAVIASAYGVQAILRLYSEETSLHAEQVLATAVGRVRFALSHLVLALGGTALLMLAMGVGAGIGGSRAGDTRHQLGRLVSAALVQLPAIWLLVGVAVVCFGLLPQPAPAAWGMLVSLFLVEIVGPVLRLPQWTLDVSPFVDTPHLPGGSMQVTPLVWLSGLAVGLIGAGLVAFRRRDVG